MAFIEIAGCTRGRGLTTSLIGHDQEEDTYVKKEFLCMIGWGAECLHMIGWEAEFLHMKGWGQDNAT